MKNLNEENVVNVLCNLVGNIIYENNNLIQVKSEYTDKIISFSNIEILKDKKIDVFISRLYKRSFDSVKIFFQQTKFV